MFTKATSGASGSTQLRVIAEISTGIWPSQKLRMERSCGARSHTTLTSAWWSPRLTRLSEMK